MSFSPSPEKSVVKGQGPIVPPVDESTLIEQATARLCSHPDVDVSAIRVVRAPLRISPLGAHIDHQLGVVTGMTIDRSVILVFAPGKDGEVQIESLNFPGPSRFTLDDVPPYEKGDWANYARGAALALQARHQLKRGLIGVIGGAMPIGGLSSSAAVTIAYLLAFEASNELAVEPAENVDHCRYTENRYIGLNNGILDQSVILHSAQNHLTQIDCQAVEVTRVPAGLPAEKLAQEFAVLVVYSGVSHALVGTDYNNRVAECRAAAAQMLEAAKLPVPEDVRLRHVSPEVYAAHGDRLELSLARRARHYFGEMARVEAGVAAWQSGDIATWGRLVSESGESSIKWYECGSPQLVTLYEILRETPGVYGTRFSGAGFRGNCIALVDPAQAEDIAEAVHAHYPAAHPDYADGYSVHLCRTDGSAGLYNRPAPRVE